RMLTIVPGDPVTRIIRAQVPFDWHADIKPFQYMLATLIAEDPSVAPDIDDPDHALCERTAAAAARALKNYPSAGIEMLGVSVPHAYWEGVVARWQADSLKEKEPLTGLGVARWQSESAKAQAAFTAARSEVQKISEKQPDFAAALSLLGRIDAGLGRKAEAVRAGRGALEVLHTSKE